MNSLPGSDIKQFLSGLKPGDSFRQVCRSMIGPDRVVTWEVTAAMDDCVICDALEFGEHAFNMDGNGGDISISIEDVDLAEIAKVLDAKLDGEDSLSNNRSMEEKPLIATNLRYLMDLEGLSQKQLEREAGVTQATISRIVKGEVKAPESSTLLPLAERFKVSVEDLLCRRLDASPFNPTSSDSATLLMVREPQDLYGRRSPIEANAKAMLVGSLRMVNWHDLPVDFLVIVERAVEDQLAKQKAEADIAGLQAKIQSLNDTLKEIGDFAHDHSTGPAVEDPLWEVRNMAYGGFVDIDD
ncbi:helix-turn-helix domain-containing protein [Acidithiobacillus ferrooxidans]|uniref:helix-turn-helix domain-containing protein n=1 Tax=Acidithiobacillus ferrooxidans TaxID=920 RepID=UPI0021473613|nr:helix-turn-helix transcriptional regulator [Acidithiobacillus ferrooxidans]MCR1346268.1 helix-turn-helix domain-containing protein [Acidithiobacillus ferrooxidans]MCR1355299.1 helix-turn-helix domain-containing protein [Acidithiobacillus ferrooxidans]